MKTDFRQRLRRASICQSAAGVGDVGRARSGARGPHDLPRARALRLAQPAAAGHPSVRSRRRRAGRVRDRPPAPATRSIAARAFTTWLFGICMRVAANYRRRRRWTHEVLSGGGDDQRPATLAAADDVLVRREQREIAERALEPAGGRQARDVRDVRDRVAVVPGDRRADERPGRHGVLAAAQRATAARKNLSRDLRKRNRAGDAMSDPTRWRDDPSGRASAATAVARGAPAAAARRRRSGAAGRRHQSYRAAVVVLVAALVADGGRGRRGGHDRRARHGRLGLAGRAA